MADKSAKRVLKRRVFYIPGYDPYPARRYRELYRVESLDQADLSGYDISIRQRRGKSNYGWYVSAVIDGVPVETEYDVLSWSDLVKSSMANGSAATYITLFRTAWIYLSTGALRRLMWLRKGPVLAALYPVAMLLAQAAVAIGLGWIVGALFSALTMPLAGWVVAVPLAVLILRWFSANDRKLMAHYLMHDFGYSAQGRGRNPPELDQRLEQFAEQISQAMHTDVDEVLVVGHSSGAHLAVHVLADLIRQKQVRMGGPNLAFLSLGQVVPMVSFLPDATQLRADLHYLSISEKLTWVDISAPGDGCSFALCDPVAVSGVAPPRKRWPLVLSAAFSQTLSPTKWAKLKRQYFRLHFQYLCAFDQPGDYDYFQITAGPQTLATRYKDRRPSESRIDVSASGHVSMVPD